MTQQEERHFPALVQLAAVGGYFAVDLFLRFCYQAVLDGPTTTSQDSSSSETNTYGKPAFLTLCCYMTFALWGPLVVFPYLHFVKKIGIFQFYREEWCGALGFQTAFRDTCIMGCILFLGNLGYVAGLQYIQVALGSALSQGEAPATVLLSVLILGRIFGDWEKRGIALSFAGIALIAIPPVLRAKAASSSAQDEQGSKNNNTEELQQIFGILSTLIGTFGFGSYQVFWPLFDGRRYTPSHPAPTKAVDAIMDTFATLTLVGVFLIAVGWLFLLVLHLTGLEAFEAPPEGIRGALILASVMSAFTDALNGVACVVATAVVVALAYPLIIPISVVLQYLINGIPISSWGVSGWIGTLLVIAGIFCLEAKVDDDEKIFDTATDQEMETGEENGQPYEAMPDVNMTTELQVVVSREKTMTDTPGKSMHMTFV